MKIDIKEYGAVGDGIYDNTSILQKAIEECANQSDCEIIIPEGIFLTGGLRFKSGVKVKLEKNAVIKGNGVTNDCIVRPGPFETCNSTKSLSSLFYIDSCDDVEIYGEGSIDGNFLCYTKGFDEKRMHYEIETYPRPEVVYAENCTNLKLSGIQICNSPFWTVHILGCNNTHFDGISIVNDLCMPNTDGIDIDRCKNTFIENCYISTADDAICPKLTEETAKYGDCDNIQVKNCKLISQSSAIKFGSSSFGGFTNCVFQDIEIKDSNRGIAFQIRDEGFTDNILFKNITIETKRFPDDWWGRGEPIYITTVPRHKNGTYGTISNIRFQNISCIAENGIFIYAKESNRINDICFEDVKVTMKESQEYTPGEYDLRPTQEVEMVQYQNMSMPIVNAGKVEFRNFVIETSKDSN